VRSQANLVRTEPLGHPLAKEKGLVLSMVLLRDNGVHC
jgi:hypothetical protein